MPRKRTRPVADHIEATEQQTAAPAETPALQDVAPAATQPDVFDEAIAAIQSRAAANQEAAPPAAPLPEPAPVPTPTHAEQVTQGRKHGEPKGGVIRAQHRPRVATEDMISLTDRNDGPRMRLHREKGYHGDSAAITFDVKPDDAVRQRLKDAGFSWVQADHAWKKPLGELPAVEMRKAHELFFSIANELRAANGLPPVGAHGHGVL